MNSAAVSRRALVVTFDQLPAAILGCYGNEWIETPHLDRLAAAGITADQCWATRLGRQTAEQALPPRRPIKLEDTLDFARIWDSLDVHRCLCLEPPK